MHNKTKTNTKLPQKMEITLKTIDKQQHNHRLITDNSLSHQEGGGFNAVFSGDKSSP